MPTLLSHSLEISAVIAGLLNIYLIGKSSCWNWLFGIITVCLYFIIFKQVGLYADMSLQFIFLLLQFYGLYQWLKKSDEQPAVSIGHIPTPTFLLALVITCGLFGGICYLLKHYSHSTTILFDAMITSLSLLSQWMMSKKWIEHWYGWILVDVISIYVYFTKGLYLTSGLYAIFLLLCVQGYLTWMKKDVFVHAN